MLLKQKSESELDHKIREWSIKNLAELKIERNFSM